MHWGGMFIEAVFVECGVDVLCSASGWHGVVCVKDGVWVWWRVVQCCVCIGGVPGVVCDRRRA